MNKNTVYIYWQDSGPLLWGYNSTDSIQAIKTGFVERDSVAKYVGNRHLIVVLPCQHISLCEVNLAARSEKHIRASLPYALEEDLASDIEHNHFAYRRTAKGVYAAVVLHTQITHWIQEIQALGLKPKLLLPEACLLPASIRSLVLHDGGFFMQFPGDPMETLAGDMAMLPTWLEFHANQGQQENSELLVWDLRQTYREKIAALEDMLSMRAVYRGGPKAKAEDAFADLLNGHQKHLEINLLQGVYDRSENFLGDFWQTYQYVIYLGLAVFAIGLLGMWLKADSLEKKYRHLGQQAEQVYRATFPHAKNVQDPKIQMQHQLRQLQENATARANDFVAILASVGNVLQRYGKGKIDRMAFQKSKLRIDLLVDSPQDIEQIAKQLQQLPKIEIHQGPVQESDAMYRANIEMAVKP